MLMAVTPQLIGGAMLATGLGFLMIVSGLAARRGAGRRD
jgi:hypothetical protein